MSRRKIATLVGSIICLLGLFLLARQCNDTGADYAREAASVLPEDTVLIFSAESIDALREQSGDEEVYPGLLNVVEEAINWDTGRWSDLEEIGFRLDQPVFFALVEIRRPVVVTSVGFNGELEQLIELPEFSELETAEIEIAGDPALLVDGKHVIFVRDDRAYSVTAYDEWFSSEPAADLREIARKVAERDWDGSAEDAKGFDELMTFEHETDAALFINVAAGLRQLMEALQFPLLMTRVDVVGASFALASGDEQRYVLQQVLFREGSRLPDRLLGPGRSEEPLRRIPGPIVSGVHVSVNPEYLVNTLGGFPFTSRGIRDNLNEVEWFLEDVLASDMEDIVELLSGEIGFFAQAPDSSSALQFALFAGVEYETQARAFLSGVSALFPDTMAQEQREGMSVVRFDTGDIGVCAAFVRDAYFWAACGEEMIDAVLSGDEDSFMEDGDFGELFDGDVVAASYADVSAMQSDYGLSFFDWYLERGGVTVGEMSFSVRREDEMFRGTLAVDIAARSGDAITSRPQEQRRGSSPYEPFPPGGVLNVDGWRVEIIGFDRSDDVGDHAMGSARDAVDLELVTVNVQATCSGRFRRRYSLGVADFGVVGGRGVQFSPSYTSDFSAELYREGRTYVGERTVDGPLYFTVPKSEGPLVLVAESDGGSPFVDDRTCQFVVLDEGAVVNVEPVPEGGGDTSSDGLVPVGQQAREGDWEAEVVEVFRGETARMLLAERGGSSAEPDEGREHIAARVRLRNVGSGQCASNFGGFGTELRDEAGERYHSNSAFSRGMSLESQLFPGAEREGWVSAQVPIDLPIHLILQYGSDLGYALSPHNLTNPFSGPGYTRENPMPVGQTAETRDWLYTVLEVVRGAEAVARIQGQSQWFRPSAHAETILIAVRVENRGRATSPTGAFDWELVDSSGQTVSQAPGSRYRPRLDTVWPDDGSVEGWLTFEVESPGGVVLMLDRSQRRFLALE